MVLQLLHRQMSDPKYLPLRKHGWPLLISSSLDELVHNYLKVRQSGGLLLLLPRATTIGHCWRNLPWASSLMLVVSGAKRVEVTGLSDKCMITLVLYTRARQSIVIKTSNFHWIGTSHNHQSTGLQKRLCIILPYVKSYRSDDSPGTQRADCSSG